jgi:hypothetical protein
MNDAAIFNVVDTGLAPVFAALFMLFFNKILTYALFIFFSL